MYILSYYFIVSYLSLRNHVPQTKSQLLSKVLITILISTLLYLIYAYSNAIRMEATSSLPTSVAALFGVESSKALMPIFVVSFVSYFTLVGRIGKGKDRLFPISHIVLTIVSFFLGAYLASLKVNREPLVETRLSSNEKTHSYDSDQKVVSSNSNEQRVKEMVDSIFTNEGAIKIVEMYVDALRKRLPIKVDDGLLQYEERRVLFYNASFNRAEKVVTYYYKYPTSRSVDFSGETLRLLIVEKRKKEEESIRRGNKNNRNCFSEAEITFNVVYLDKEGDEIFRFMIDKEEYI